MLTDVGEYVVGAYLKVVERCDFVDYNVRPPGGGLEGLNELDVVGGLDFKTRTAYVCEVTTHICGLLYGSKEETVARVANKHDRQKKYADRFLSNFENHRFQFWSPVVPSGYLTTNLSLISGLELVINGKYKQRIKILQERAREETHDARNPVFRLLQILGHMRDDPPNPSSC